MEFEPAIWLYKPLSVYYAKVTGMTQNTATIPACILCQRPPNFAPARLGFLSDGGEVALFQICSDCTRGRDIDAELEQLVLNAIRPETVAATTTETETPVTAPLPDATALAVEAGPKVGIGSPPMAAARTVPATWVKAAMKAWTTPAA